MSYTNPLLNPCECGECIACRREAIEWKRIKAARERRRESAGDAPDGAPKEPKYWFGETSGAPLSRCENRLCQEITYVRDMRLVPRMIQVPEKGFEAEWKAASKARREHIPSHLIRIEENLCPKCHARRSARGGVVFEQVEAPKQDLALNQQLHAVAAAQRLAGFPMGRRTLEPTVHELRQEIALLRRQVGG